MKLTQDSNIVNEDFSDEDDSMIITFQLNQLHKHSRRVIEDKMYTDTKILIDTGYICSVFKNNNMLLKIRASNQMLRAYNMEATKAPI